MKTQSKLVSATLACLMTFSCASTHPGQMGSVEKGDGTQPLRISVQRQSSFSDDHYTFLTFTVENMSNDMLRIKSTDLDLGNANGTSNVLVGKDLAAWIDAEEQEKEKEKQHKKIAQILLMLGGAGLGIAGATSHNAGLEAAGIGTFATGEGWFAASRIDDSIENAENPKRVPDQHIYAAFSVPAGKFVRKWVVIQHPVDEKIPLVNLTMMLENGSEATYAMLTK